MKKCFLLGAGASLGYRNKKEYANDRERPPGSTEFFKRGQELGIFQKDDFEGLREIYRGYEAAYGDGSGYYDIEDVMEYAIDKLEKEYYGQLTYYIYELFRYYALKYKKRRADNYRKLADHYKDTKYSVISLNYDILFEKALVSRGLWAGYREEVYKNNYNTVPVVKLHGSINAVNKIPRNPIENVSINVPGEFKEAAEHLQGFTIEDSYASDGVERIEIPEVEYMGPEDVDKFSYNQLLEDESEPSDN